MLLLAFGLAFTGVTGCTAQPDEGAAPAADTGQSAPVNEADDGATAQAMRDTAQATNAALREADSAPAPTNAMSGDHSGGSEEAASEGAEQTEPEAPEAAQLAMYEPTWGNSDPEGLTAAEEGQIGRPALVWFHADW